MREDEEEKEGLTSTWPFKYMAVQVHGEFLRFSDHSLFRLRARFRAYEGHRKE